MFEKAYEYIEVIAVQFLARQDRVGMIAVVTLISVVDGRSRSVNVPHSLGWLYSILMKAVHRDARDVQRICCVTLAITRVPRHRWIMNC